MPKPCPSTEASANLNPCPFCGSTGLKLDHLSEPDDWFVRCAYCEVQQIANYTREEAVRRWNQRANDADGKRINVLEEFVNREGALVLHTGDANCHGHYGLGLRPGKLRRTLREAIDQMAPGEAQAKEQAGA